jgi:hypothetical protein
VDGASAPISTGCNWRLRALARLEDRQDPLGDVVRQRLHGARPPGLVPERTPTIGGPSMDLWAVLESANVRALGAAGPGKYDDEWVDPADPRACEINRGRSWWWLRYLSKSHFDRRWTSFKYR